MLAVHIEARTCAAHLALVEEYRGGGTRGGLLQVGVGHDDGRRLAAQLQGHAGHVFHGRLADLLTDFGGTGEGQFVYAGVAGESGTGIQPGAGDYVEYAIRIAGFLHQFGQLQGGQRGFVGRLEHHGAAGGQRRPELPAGQQQRKVPGDDGTDDADRFAADETVELIVRHQRQRRLHRRAFNLGGPASHVAQEVDGQLHVHDFGHRSALAIVQALEFGQLLRVALHQFGQTPQQVLPLTGTHAAPGRVIEGSTRRLDGAVDIVTVSAGHFAQHFAGGRVAKAHGLATLRVLPVGANAHFQFTVEKSLGTGEDRQGRQHGAAPLVIGCAGRFRNHHAKHEIRHQRIDIACLFTRLQKTVDELRCSTLRQYETPLQQFDPLRFVLEGV
ncbi:hypothetical protein D3C77_169780 [compost metagenome]